MKIVIFGSRTFTDYTLFSSVVASLMTQFNITEVISGGARGADTLAIRWANQHNLPCTIMNAEWERYGRAAGPIRNKEMAKIAEGGIGFWNGATAHSGTFNMINTCRKLNVPCKIYRTDTNNFIDI